MPNETESRLEPLEKTRIAVWAAAAGRCTFCNRSVLSNDDLGETVAIGELAHNVGWGKKSPRGASGLSGEERRQAQNLVLLCRNCHKPIDDDGVIGRYSVSRLAELKQDHQERIRALTEIGADRSATLLRVVGPIRSVNPELNRDTVLTAATSDKLFPVPLPGSYYATVDIDLTGIPDPGTPENFAISVRTIDQVLERVHDGVRQSAISRLAVFAFARIPLLVHLGASLDDKVPAILFQRQRSDDVNAWRWPDNPPSPPEFAIESLQAGSDSSKAALVVNLSGSIQLDHLPSEILASHHVYAISPSGDDVPGPSLISSLQAVQQFDRIARKLLAQVEKDHGQIERIPLFAAVPVSVAITLGRVLMPNVSPAWEVFDRNEEGRFFSALEVRR